MLIVISLILFSVASATNYMSDNLSGLKHDINQCQDGTHDCVSPQVCENLPGAHGGYLCKCPSGFVANTALQKTTPALRHTIYDPCHDKTEGDYCTLCDPADTTCAETAVSKQCDSDGVCQSNTVVTTPSPETSACLDIDECIEKTDTCTSSQTCENTVGSFTCIDDEPESTTTTMNWTTFMIYLLGGLFLLILLVYIVLSCLGVSL